VVVGSGGVGKPVDLESMVAHLDRSVGGEVGLGSVCGCLVLPRVETVVPQT
jgi:hypothetical protein